MNKSKQPANIRKNVLLALFKSMIIPVSLLAFYFAAPHWLNSKIREGFNTEINADAHLSPAEKQASLNNIANLDFQQICFSPPSGLEKLHNALDQAGLVSRFRRLRWGLILSALLVVGLVIASLAIFTLNGSARQSQAALIRSYRLSWKITMTAALAKVFVLIPLLAYGSYEFTVLLADEYYPKLLIAIILGGIFALWRSASILLKQVPLEFREQMSREVTSGEAPEIWQAVTDAAAHLQTSPPDHIVIGLQFNFYVTELAVCHDGGRTKGKTLYLSYPLLKQLSTEEVVAIIGHELGHFIGEDTRMTREFYPFRLKTHATMMAMGQSGWVGWPSFQFLNFFGWSFGETEQAASRRRELLADQKAAALTSPQTIAHALVKFQVAAEAFKRGLADALQNKIENPLAVPLQTVVREKLAADTGFWSKLFEHELPHPLDSHPPLNVRLEALQQNIGADEARTIALAESEGAYGKWFSARDALFTALMQRAKEAIGKLRLTTTDYQTAEGKALLDQHFPEKKWNFKQSSLWIYLALLVVLTVVFLTAAVAVHDLTGGSLLVLLAALLLYGAVLLWKRHRHGVLVLNADGLFYSGWMRPMRFTDVQQVLARKAYSTITLTFRLKEKQPGFWKASLDRRRVKALTISLSNFGAGQKGIAETIFRYLNRQTDPS